MPQIINSSNANIYQRNKNSNGVCSSISKANIIGDMKRRELTDEEKAESLRLKSIYEARKDEAKASGRKLNQTDISEQCGWSNQSAFSQFANGRIPLNLEALLKLSSALNFDVSEVSPRLAKLINKPLLNKKQDHIEVIGDISPWDDNTPLDDDEVEIPLIKDIQLSAGCGRIASSEHNTGRKLRFDKKTLIKQGVSFNYALCVPVSGNSMEPLIQDGSVVGIDTANTNIVDGKIYAVVIENELARVKQLYRLPNNRVRLRSFNRDEYEDEEYSLDDIRVVGKVFWSSVLWD
ncbi:XRE family transcriptional regulator [Entomomonas moraniae]|nr:helix-turn-helix transcriptional regulator [Entomomonas moraniae]